MRTRNDDDEAPKEPNRWVFRKDVSVGNTISMAGLIIGLFAWGNAIERRLVVLEEKVAVNVIANDRQDAVVKELKDEQRQRLDRIEDKLDTALAAMRSAGATIPVVPYVRKNRSND
jgi:hypothetical protein